MLILKALLFFLALTCTLKSVTVVATWFNRVGIQRELLPEYFHVVIAALWALFFLTASL
jgi:hypothetical protein